jgi:hypothetical protein
LPSNPFKPGLIGSKVAIIGLLFLLLIPVAVGLEWFGYAVHPLPSGTLLFAASRGTWLLPAFPVAAVVAGVLHRAILPVMLGDRHSAYRSYENQVYGRVARQGEGAMFGAVIVIALLASFLLADNYVAVVGDHLVDDPFFGFSAKEYRISDATRVLSAPAYVSWTGRPARQRLYVIHFSDGRRWNSRWFPGDEFRGGDARVAAYVASAAGLEIRRRDVLERDEL